MSVVKKTMLNGAAELKTYNKVFRKGVMDVVNISWQFRGILIRNPFFTSHLRTEAAFKR